MLALLRADMTCDFSPTRTNKHRLLKYLGTTGYRKQSLLLLWRQWSKNSTNKNLCLSPGDWHMKMFLIEGMGTCHEWWLRLTVEYDILSFKTVYTQKWLDKYCRQTHSLFILKVSVTFTDQGNVSASKSCSLCHIANEWQN